MAEGVNVRFPEKLREFVEERTNGFYGSVSEYIGELVRRDFEAEEARKWSWLKSEITPGLTAGEEEFVAVHPEDVINRNRQ